jgi:hypothetical protein
MHVVSYAIPVIASYALKHLMHWTILPLAHIHSFTLGHVELEFGELTEQAQAEDLANLALNQGKPWCIKPILLIFYFESCFMIYYDHALSLLELYGT